MSEDGIHGTPASNEQFARNHPNYNNSGPTVARTAGRPPVHKGGRPPIHHVPPKQKDATIPTTRENHAVKKTCHLVSFSAECEHDARKAVKEEGEYVLSVVPHDSGSWGHGNTKTSGGVGNKRVRTVAQDREEEQHRDKTAHKLDAEHEKLENRAAKLRARKDTNTRNYRRAASRLSHAQSSHDTRKGEFIKDNRAKNYFGAELYLDQGDPTIDDKITLQATMARHCSKHPAWALWDCSTNEWVDTHQGEKWLTDALLPPVIDYSALPSVLPKFLGGPHAYWLKGVKPRLYKIHLYTCEGDEVIHVKVYPLVESGIDITIEHEGDKNEPAKGSWHSRIKESKEKFESVVGVISRVTPAGGSVSLEILPEGKFSLLNKWVEEEKTSEVVWEADVVVEATIIKLTIVRPIIAGLPELLMRAVRQVADAGIDITLTIGASVNVTCKWKQAPEQKMHFEPSGGVKGEVTLGISAHLHLGMPILNDNVISANADAKTAAELSSSVKPNSEGGEEKIAIEVKGQWKHPLVVSGSVTFFSGKPLGFSKDLLGSMPEHNFGTFHPW